MVSPTGAFLGNNGSPAKVWAPPPGMSLAALEKVAIQATLQRTGGNIKEFAIDPEPPVDPDRLPVTEATSPESPTRRDANRTAGSSPMIPTRVMSDG